MCVSLVCVCVCVLCWVIRLQTDTYRCHLILHSPTFLANRHRAGQCEGIEPCSVSLTCAGDTGANEDTLQSQWLLIVHLHFQQSIIACTAKVTGILNTKYKKENVPSFPRNVLCPVIVVCAACQ